MQLLRATARAGSGTLVSRVLGFARDVVIARVFGASAATDAFFVAFRIPNLMRRLFAEGSFSLAFVPVLSEYRSRANPAELRALLDALAGVLMAALLVVTGAGVLLAPVLIGLFAPGFTDDPESFELTVDLLRVTFPYLLLVSVTALAGGILNTFERFWLPAVTPALLNVALITAALAGVAYFEPPIKALAWAVTAAGVLQVAVQVPALQRLGLLPRPRLRPGHPGVRRIARLMIPTLFGSSVAQINVLLDTLLASLLVTGSVSWLYYGHRLVEFPLGVFGIALSVVILPRLSRSFADANHGDYVATLDWALRLALVIAIPAALGLALLALPIVSTLFQYGEFGGADARMAALALLAYAGGLPAFVAVKVLAPGYYSRQDTTTPVRCAVAALVSNMVLNVVFLAALCALLFEGPWHGPLHALENTPGLHPALALASAVAAYINAGLLWRGLIRRGVWAPQPGWGGLLGRVAGAAGLMACLLIALRTVPSAWDAGAWWWRGLWLLSVIGAGAASYFAALLAGGLRPAQLRPPQL